MAETQQQVTDQDAAERENGVPGIDADIDRILAQADALAELASGEPSGAQAYDFNVRWGALLAGRLERLRYYARRGELTGEQRARYVRMEERLREVTPLAERVAVSRPTDPPDDPDER